MEKKDFSLPEVKDKTIEYYGKTIILRPYLKIAEINELIRSYLNNYFAPHVRFSNLNTYDYLGAEYRLMLMVVEMLTDIRILDDEGNLAVDPDDFVERGFWDYLKSEIYNYADFQTKLDRVVNDRKEELALINSVGFMVDDAVKLVKEFVLKLTSLDFDPALIEKIKETSQEVVDAMEKSPIAPAFQEAEKQAAEVTQKKTRRKKSQPQS